MNLNSREDGINGLRSGVGNCSFRTTLASSTEDLTEEINQIFPEKNNTPSYGKHSNRNNSGTSRLPWWIDSFNLEYFFLSRREYENLIDEVIYQYSMSKKKLQRKREALLVVANDLEACMKEREQLISVLRKYMENCECPATTIAKINSPGTASDIDPLRVIKTETATKAYESSKLLETISEDSSRTALGSAVKEIIKQRNILREEVENLNQRLGDAHDDIKLLRETVARQRLGGGNGGGDVDSLGNFRGNCNELGVKAGRRSQEQVDKLAEVLTQLELEKSRANDLERELIACKDNAKQYKAEKEFFLQRSERLNRELNYLLCNETDNSIIDIDSLTLENKYLKQQLSQVTTEKNSLKEQHGKLKENYTQQVNGQSISSTHGCSGNRLRFNFSSNSKQALQSLKQIREYLIGSNKNGLPVNQQFVHDLHSLSSTLVECLDDKNIALANQKSTNRVLGLRVRELERKLKTLENSGLWNTREREKRLDTLRRELNFGDLMNKTRSTSCFERSPLRTFSSSNCNKSESLETEATDDTMLDELAYLGISGPVQQPFQATVEEEEVFQSNLDPSSSVHIMEQLDEYFHGNSNEVMSENNDSSYEYDEFYSPEATHHSRSASHSVRESDDHHRIETPTGSYRSELESELGDAEEADEEYSNES